MAGRYLNFDSDFFNKYATLAYYLSKGASGNVYGPIQWNDMQLAIKQATFADGKVTDEFKKDIEVKKDIWTSLEHKHLTRIHSVDLNELPKAMYIVMEFAAGGSLNKTLKSLGSENKLPIDVITDWAKQIAEGMMYLHEKNIVHRDLKSLNILLMEPFDIRNAHTMISLKIADFDDVKEHDHTATMSFVGTCAYMAPEVLQNQWFSKVSDVWSYGVVIWEMLSGDIPYKGLDSTGIIFKSQNGTLDNLPLDQSFPEDYKLLLERCWETTSWKRPSFDEIFCVLQRMDEAPTENEGDIISERMEDGRKQFEDDHLTLDEPLQQSLRDEAPTEIEGDIINESLYFDGRKQFEEDHMNLDELLQQPVRATDINGLAVLGQEVFISRLQRPDIEVYNSTTFYSKRRITVDGMTNPEHIVSCSVNNCLYAFDWNYKEELPAMLRIDPKKGKIIKTWNIDGRGGRLSVANDANVILNLNYEAKLHEYTANGELIREINLDLERTEIFSSWHAVKLDSGLFVVCHGSYDDPLSRVCLLSTMTTTCTNTPGRTDEVEILKAFGAEPGVSINSLMQPMYLSVRKNGSILVTDESNRRAVLLSSDLDEPQILVSEERGSGSPWRTCFDESTDQWFVANHHGFMVCRVKDGKVKR